MQRIAHSGNTAESERKCVTTKTKQVKMDTAGCASQFASAIGNARAGGTARREVIVWVYLSSDEVTGLRGLTRVTTARNARLTGVKSA